MYILSNAWVSHVKQFAVDNNLSYDCALSFPDCKNSYKNKNKKNKKQKNQKQKNQKQKNQKHKK